MIKRLEQRLPFMIEKLVELGAYQRKQQGLVQTQSKSGASMAESWAANDVFSEVDLTTERHLIDFCQKELGSIPIISEEFNAKVATITNKQSDYYLVIDPLDGTKPYLEGNSCFAISMGLFYKDRFLFAINFYPALESLYYSFDEAETVMDIHGSPVPLPMNWPRTCYMALGFNELVDEQYHKAEAFKKATGVEIADFPRCATFIFKQMIEGKTLAYLSIDPYLWDLGPSSLLLSKSGCGMYDLDGKPVDFQWLTNPPFCQPAVAAMPKVETKGFLIKLQDILAFRPDVA